MPDASYVAHVLLFRKKAGAGVNNGANAECLGLHPDSELLAGWAPGAGNWNFPRHVGMGMGQGRYVLQVHYFNNTGAPKQDSSGIDVCITQNLRPETAGIHWLGSEFITLPPQQAKDEVSVCHPANQTQPIQVLTWWPRMRFLGVNMKVEIDRVIGPDEEVFDEPFAFNDQIQYALPRVINPGDSIRTTCSFVNTTTNMVLFGEAASAELCYNFVVAYPESSLVSAIQGIHQNSCPGPP